MSLLKSYNNLQPINRQQLLPLNRLPLDNSKVYRNTLHPHEEWLERHLQTRGNVIPGSGSFQVGTVFSEIKKRKNFFH